MLLVFAVLIPFLGALLAPFVARPLGARAGWPLALAFAPALALATLIPGAQQGAPAQGSAAWVPGLELSLSFRADGFSLLFALLVAVMGVLVMIYAASYLGPKERHGRFYSFLLLFGGAMLGFVLSDNLIAMFAFWELTSVASFLLIGFWDARRAAQDGALKALVITSAGGLALLASVILLIIAGGSVNLSQLDFAAVRSSPSFVPALVLLLFGRRNQIGAVSLLYLAADGDGSADADFGVPALRDDGQSRHRATRQICAALRRHCVVRRTALLGTHHDGLGFVSGPQARRPQGALGLFDGFAARTFNGALRRRATPFAATAHLVNHAAFKAALFLIVGSIDHETGSRSIRELSGLARKLPWTFLMAVPAALSMAGLPPFGGFISKELFYEAVLRSGPLPLALAVVGSVMTLTYSLRFLGVFFGPYRCHRPNVHEAPLGMLLPPALLSVLVILFGVFPWNATLATPIVALAAPALAFEAKALYLWHGLNAALIWSFWTWGAGVVLYLLRAPFGRLQGALTPAWNANTVYYALLGGLEHIARSATRRTQNATFAAQLRVLWLPVALLGVGFTFVGLGPYLPTSVTPVPLEFLAAALLVVGGTYGVIVARTRISALIFSGLAGFSLVLLFVALRAPDLALTQLLIETVTVILFVSVFRYLPKLTRYRRSRRASIVDAALSGAVGLTVFGALLAVQTPLGERLQTFFLTQSKEGGGGYNVVNVILVDFRGYDTLGEITVLAIVGVSVYALLKTRTVPEDEEPDDGRR